MVDGRKSKLCKERSHTCNMRAVSVGDVGIAMSLRRASQVLENGVFHSFEFCAAHVPPGAHMPIHLPFAGHNFSFAVGRVEGAS